MSPYPKMPRVHPLNQAPPPPGFGPKVSNKDRQKKIEEMREPFLRKQAEVLRDKVDRIVVLMLENRSFDHMLGWLGPKNEGLDHQSNVPLPTEEQERKGIKPKPVEVFEVSDPVLPLSPPHAGGATLDQINDGEMDGFLSVFNTHREGEAAVVEEIAGQSPRFVPMAYYPQGVLTSYDHFVEHHTVCARYHASVAGGTWPNRIYFYAGTANNEPGNGKVRPGTNDYDEKMPKRLLIDLLDEGPVDWCIYAHGIAWMRLFPHLFRRKMRQTRDIRKFDRDCKDGKLPSVVFVDPNWADIGFLGRANDDLAPCNLMRGQKLVAEVYNSLLAQKDGAWEKTMFVVTYDEHGGFYDHVPPPAPIGYNLEETQKQFKSYGVRVPTFVASAYAPAALSDTLFDHASLHATIHRTFLGDDVRLLSGRAQVAETFGVLLTEKDPRPAPPPMTVPDPETTRQDRKEWRAVNRVERRERVKKEVKDFIAKRVAKADARQTNRQERRADRREDRGETRTERVETRDARRDERKEGRSDRREDRNEKRQDQGETREERREERTDAREVRQEERQERREERQRPTADDEDGGFRAWVLTAGNDFD